MYTSVPILEEFVQPTHVRVLAQQGYTSDFSIENSNLMKSVFPSAWYRSRQYYIRIDDFIISIFDTLVLFTIHSSRVEAKMTKFSLSCWTF